MRRAAPSARRHSIVRCISAWSNQRIGAGATIITAVALTALHESSTSAISAGCRQRCSLVTARMVRPTSQPTAAHGSNIALVRETYGRMYGESWYTTAATTAPCLGSPSRRAAQ